MNFDFHFRALDEAGSTIRQSQAAFPTFDSCLSAAAKAERQHGDKHVVCISLDPADPRNKKVGDVKCGFLVVDADPDAEAKPKPKPK